MNRNFRQPRGELSSPGKLIKPRIRPDIRILYHVLSFIIVAKNGTRDSEQPLIIAAHENLIKRYIARSDALHDLFV